MLIGLKYLSEGWNFILATGNPSLQCRHVKTKQHGFRNRRLAHVGNARRKMGQVASSEYALFDGREHGQCTKCNEQRVAAVDVSMQNMAEHSEGLALSFGCALHGMKPGQDRQLGN